MAVSAGEAGADPGSKTVFSLVSEILVRFDEYRGRATEESILDAYPDSGAPRKYPHLCRVPTVSLTWYLPGGRRYWRVSGFPFKRGLRTTRRNSTRS